MILDLFRNSRPPDQKEDRRQCGVTARDPIGATNGAAEMKLRLQEAAEKVLTSVRGVCWPMPMRVGGASAGEQAQ